MPTLASIRSGLILRDNKLPEDFKNEVISRLSNLESHKDKSIGQIATLEALLVSQGRDIKAIKGDVNKNEDRLERISALLWKFIGGITVVGFLTGVALTIISMFKQG